MDDAVVVLGDATDLSTIADNSVALIVTSPPYNAGIDYPEYVDQMAWPDYGTMARAACWEMERVLMPGGRVFMNVQPTVPAAWSKRKDGRKQASEERINIGRMWETALASASLSYRDTIVWIQDSHDGACSWGSWLRPSAPNMRGSHELIYVYYKEHWKRTPPPYRTSWTDSRVNLGGDWTDLVRNVWTIPPSRSKHPATFPIDVPARAIRLSTWPDEIVLDPFAGSCTTGRAALLLGRRFIGVDLDPASVEVGRELLAGTARLKDIWESV